ncbi:hypothetical protein RR48_09021 [Papilio machaon]|uniref:Uncharacterized protein n=1 Tax=Papilio machaon TaxID=76193 RepID=A0A194R3E3_PAPMA|nr:hypothetical protein RR48_09021 [Papilio machaon]
MLHRTPTKWRPSSTQKVAEIAAPVRRNILTPQYKEIETDSEPECHTHPTHTSPPKREINTDTHNNTRLREARSAYLQAMTHLHNSRNLKREIKDGIESALNRLFKILREIESSEPI